MTIPFPPEVTADDLRTTISDLLGRAQYAGERIIVTRHGTQVAAIVPMSDLKRLLDLPPAA